ncbi:MAG TPA: 23S rRNA (adenine(2503)-C(2))-methyltransferase RlmN, partial [Pirellulales bacterium]
MHLLLEPNSTALADWLVAHGQPAYRAAQVRRWLFAGRARSMADMTDLSANLRAELAADFRLWTSEIIRRHTTDDGTEKLLLRLADGQQIECVLLRDGV